MRRACVALAALALVLLPSVALGTAKDYAHLERVEVEPTFAGLAKVRAWVNLVHQSGDFIAGWKADDLALVIGSAKRREIPGVFAFDATGEDLELVIVLEVSFSFREVVEDLEEPLADFLKGLPKSTRVSLVWYGTEVHVQPFDNTAKAIRDWHKVVADDDADAPRLVDALQKALRQMMNQKHDNRVRRVILVISDGVEVENDDVEAMRNNFRKIAKTAQDADIVIETVAFSPIDRREPMLNLGQISKKTFGTFRWARNRADVPGNLEAVKQDLRKTPVLTYLVPAEAVAGRKVKLVCKGCGGEQPLESNEVKASASRCGLQACGEGHTCVEAECVALTFEAPGGGAGIWIALFGILVAGGGAGAVIVLKKRRARAEAPATAPGTGAPGQPGQPQQPQGPIVVNLPAGYNLPPGFQLPAGYQVAGAPPVAAPAANAPVTGPQLQFVSGPRQGHSVPLRHGFLVGKMAGSDLQIDDGYTSTHHAQFIVDGAGVYSVMDMNSTNGTYVNGTRTAMARLQPGTVIRIGQTELRYLQG